MQSQAAVVPEVRARQLVDSEETEALRRENRQLKKDLDVATRLFAPCAGHCKIDRINPSLEGSWQGKWRARYGFRVIGLYQTQEEAEHHIALYASRARRRLRPGKTSAAPPIS